MYVLLSLASILCQSIRRKWTPRLETGMRPVDTASDSEVFYSTDEIVWNVQLFKMYVKR